jgi:DNA polymerase-3 subunit alpha
MKSAEEMGKIFGHHPETIYNTRAIVDRIDAEDISRNIMGGMRLPNIEIPEQYKSPFEYMEKQAWQGLKSLGWDKSEPHVNALKKEIADTKVALDNNGMAFDKYFLIVSDYLKFAKDNGIFTGGSRGSGGGSVLLRTLDITYGPDPLKYGLLWERFLGFDDRRFYNARDFGVETAVDLASIMDQAEENAEEFEDIEEDREYDDDPGGVDRY